MSNNDISFFAIVMTSLFSCSIFVSYLSCFMFIRLVEVNCNKIYLFRQYFIVIFIHTIFIKHYLVFAFFLLYLSIFIIFCTNSSFRYIFMPVYICNLLLAMVLHQITTLFLSKNVHAFKSAKGLRYEKIRELIT